MEDRFEDQTKVDIRYDLPQYCDNINTDKIAISPYWKSYTAAWDKRFPLVEEVEYVEVVEEVEEAPVVVEEVEEEEVEEAPVVVAAPAPCKKCVCKAKRHLFPISMMFIFSILAIAVAVVAIFNIEVIAEYVKLFGQYANVVDLFDSLSNGDTTLTGIFSYVLPIAAYLSLALVVVVFAMCIAAFASKKKVGGFVWVTLISFLLWVLAVVAYYLVVEAPAMSIFFDFGAANGIGIGAVIIAGLELLSFIFSFFAYSKKKCK